ncbi:MAG TPA: hypothetical protein VK363_03615 [Pyrinomonadaceae bacterium]|nr:hypothetical protein [Pyrinomonadaceae bacterium]
MNDKQRRRLERLARAARLGNSMNASFPATGKGGQALSRLAAAIDDAEAQATASITNQRLQQKGTGNRKDARRALQSHIASISDTAATIAFDHPEVKDSFRRPRSTPNDQTLLSTARSFAAAALPLKARFIEYDMPADFLERLDQSISDFEGAIDEQTSGESARLAANAALEEAIKRGEQELEKFDTAFRNKFSSDTSKLAAWESARHLERAPRPRRDAETPVPPNPPTSNA